MQSPPQAPYGSNVATDYIYAKSDGFSYILGIKADGTVIANYTDLQSDMLAGYTCNSSDGYWTWYSNTDKPTITQVSTIPKPPTPGQYVVMDPTKTTLPIAYTLGGNLPSGCSTTYVINNGSMISVDGTLYLSTYPLDVHVSSTYPIEIGDIPTTAGSFTCSSIWGDRQVVPYTYLSPTIQLTANYDTTICSPACISPNICIENKCIMPYYDFEGGVDDNGGTGAFDAIGCNGSYILSAISPMSKPPGSAVATDYMYTNPTTGTVLMGVNADNDVIQNYADLDDKSGYVCNNFSGGAWFGNVYQPLTITQVQTQPTTPAPGAYVYGVATNTVPTAYTLGGG